MLKSEIQKASPLRLGIRKEAHIFLARKRNTGHQNWKSSKIISTEGTTSSVENFKDSIIHKIKIVRANEPRKIAGEKLTYKNQLHFYTLLMNNLKRTL